MLNTLLKPCNWQTGAGGQAEATNGTRPALSSSAACVPTCQIGRSKKIWTADEFFQKWREWALDLTSRFLRTILERLMGRESLHLMIWAYYLEIHGKVECVLPTSLEVLCALWSNEVQAHDRCEEFCVSLQSSTLHWTEVIAIPDWFCMWHFLDRLAQRFWCAMKL